MYGYHLITQEGNQNCYKLSGKSAEDSKWVIIFFRERGTFVSNTL